MWVNTEYGGVIFYLQNSVSNFYAIFSHFRFCSPEKFQFRWNSFCEKQRRYAFLYIDDSNSVFWLTFTLIEPKCRQQLIIYWKIVGAEYITSSGKPLFMEKQHCFPRLAAVICLYSYSIFRVLIFIHCFNSEKRAFCRIMILICETKRVAWSDASQSLYKSGFPRWRHIL